MAQVAIRGDILTDAALIEATKNGSQHAFQALVERYESRVASTVIGMLGHVPEADDVGQETFIRFYRNLENFQGQASVGTYITRIAINLSLNEIKRRKRRSFFSIFSPSDDEEMPALDIEDPNATAEYDDTADLVHWALQQLDPKFRSVLVLRLLEGYSTKETADILALPTGTIMSRLTRAQQKLKDILKPYSGAYHEPALS